MKTNIDEKTGPTEVIMNYSLGYVALLFFVIFLIPGAFSAPVANFTVSPAPGDIPPAVHFTGTTTGNPTGSIVVTSTLSGAQVHLDGNSTGLTTPCKLTSIRAGPHEVVLKLDGYDDLFSKVTVTPGQVAEIKAVVNRKSNFPDFTVSPVTGTAPLTVKCTDTSTGKSIRYYYNFGDGATVLGPNPVHTYRNPGTYSITLTSTRYNSTTNSIVRASTTKRDVITVDCIPFVMPVAEFTASPTNGTAPLTVTFRDQSVGDPKRYHYNFGDGANSSDPDPVHTYRDPGVYNVTLLVLKPDPGTGIIKNSATVKTGMIIVERTPGTPLHATIKQVDHLMIQLPEPDLVYNLFSGELGLPVAWPMVNYGAFSTGGVSFGNVNMELLNSSQEMRQQGLVPGGNGIVGVAFQPSEPLGLTVQALDSHQVPHGAILPFTITGNGTPTTLWNNLVLSEMMPGSMIFYCEYTFNQTGFRKRMEQSLAAAGGGPLGITGMKEITVEYADPSVLEKWQVLLPEVKGGTPELRDGGEGVTVHLEKSGRNALSSITVQVKSLERAKRVLLEKGLLGAVSEGQVSINPEKISGLQVYVTG